MKRFSVILMLLCMMLSCLCLSGCSDSEKAKVDSNIESVKESKQPEKIQVILGSGEVYEFMGVKKGNFFYCEDDYEIDTFSSNPNIYIYKDGQRVLTSNNATIVFPDRMP